MIFSHDLIHQIGGEDDTNRNTTRRLLLLLESAPVGREDAYHRVFRNILNRYLLEDRGFWKVRNSAFLGFCRTILQDTDEPWQSTLLTSYVSAPERVGPSGI